MRPFLPALLLLVCCARSLSAPPESLGAVPPDELRAWDQAATVTHRLLLTNPQTQVMTVETVVRNVDSETLTFTLPTWRPGRYVVLDFAGTVYDVQAEGPNNRALPVEKTSKTTWKVTTEGQSNVLFRYKLYANELNVRTRHIDDSHAFLSGSSVFMLVEGRRAEPQRVELTLPKNWKIAGGLDRHPSRQDVMLAPDYDTLVDAPLELGQHRRYAFDVDGRQHELIVWGEPLPDPGKVVEDLKKLSETQHAFWGTKPYGRYVWLLHVGPGLRGGTEHFNSTIMQVTSDRLEPGKNYRGFLGLCSHEFFHTWNVKRLRPAGLSPYEFVHENYTDLLWVAEGSTSYYDDLLLVRAGLLTPKQYFSNLADAVGGFRERPGRTVQSLAMSSYDAWIKFNQPHDHSANTTVSFYRKGALVNLMLDMQIRRDTENRGSLDAVFRAAFDQFPLGGTGISANDLRSLIEKESGESFERFFADFVDGVAPLPIEDALHVAGLKLSLKEDEDDASEDDSVHEEEPVTLGLSLSDRDGLAAVTRVASDGPAFDAGLQVDDLIVALDGRRLRANKLNDRLEDYQPDDQVKLTLLRRDRLREIEVTLVAKPLHKYKIERVDQPTELQRKVYESWLGQPWPDDDDDKETDADE